MLELLNLSCERGERTLFAGLNCQLAKGEGLRIAGANGSGKTTLLRSIAGLSQRYGGDIRWCGESLAQSSYRLQSELLYFGHSPGVKPTLTALENIRWWMQLQSGVSLVQSDTNLDDHIYQAMATLGLAGYEFTPCHQLSAGQQRRVALARLFLSKHPLWILDEPFTAIDVKGVAVLQKRFSEHLTMGGMVILTTHQPLDNNEFKTLDVDQYAP